MLRAFVRALVFFFSFCGVSGPVTASVRLVVMFDQGVCTMPAAEDSVYSLQAVSLPNEIFSLLEEGGVSTVASAFPDFELSDTLVTTRSNDIVRVSDLSRVFYLECETEEQAASLASALVAFPGVVYVAQPDEQIQLACDYGAVSDPYYSGQNQNGYLQWNLNSCGSSNYLGHILVEDADMDIPEAWTLTRGSDETIFVFDNGIISHSITHFELYNRAQGAEGRACFLQG